ncbi:MAG: hypothetical protein K2X81_05025 [Candidatus Obscuribacterales bacterium]|nr:hypothetical protein [Candidatus Obscuribacterales bacterium]
MKAQAGRTLFFLFISCFMNGSIGQPSKADETNSGQTQDSAKIRISRPMAATPEFHSPSDGMTNRWWRKFRNPSFCPFVICGGSCADISGKPKIGAYTQKQLDSDITPCSLDSISGNGKSGSCCMDTSLEQASHDCCSDESCSASKSHKDESAK